MSDQLSLSELPDSVFRAVVRKCTEESEFGRPILPNRLADALSNLGPKVLAKVLKASDVTLDLSPEHPTVYRLAYLAITKPDVWALALDKVTFRFRGNPSLIVDLFGPAASRVLAKTHVLVIQDASEIFSTPGMAEESRSDQSQSQSQGTPSTSLSGVRPTGVLCSMAWRHEKGNIDAISMLVARHTTAPSDVGRSYSLGYRSLASFFLPQHVVGGLPSGSTALPAPLPACIFLPVLDRLDLSRLSQGPSPLLPGGMTEVFTCVKAPPQAFQGPRLAAKQLVIRVEGTEYLEAVVDLSQTKECTLILTEPAFSWPARRLVIKMPMLTSLDLVYKDERVSMDQQAIKRSLLSPTFALEALREELGIAKGPAAAASVRASAPSAKNRTATSPSGSAAAAASSVRPPSPKALPEDVRSQILAKSAAMMGPHGSAAPAPGPAAGPVHPPAPSSAPPHATPIVTPSAGSSTGKARKCPQPPVGGQDFVQNPSWEGESEAAVAGARSEETRATELLARLGFSGTPLAATGSRPLGSARGAKPPHQQLQGAGYGGLGRVDTPQYSSLDPMLLSSMRSPSPGMGSNGSNGLAAGGLFMPPLGSVGSTSLYYGAMMGAMGPGPSVAANSAYLAALASAATGGATGMNGSMAALHAAVTQPHGLQPQVKPAGSGTGPSISGVSNFSMPMGSVGSVSLRDFQTPGPLSMPRQGSLVSQSSMGMGPLGSLGMGVGVGSVGLPQASQSFFSNAPAALANGMGAGASSLQRTGSGPGSANDFFGSMDVSALLALSDLWGTGTDQPPMEASAPLSERFAGFLGH